MGVSNKWSMLRTGGKVKIAQMTLLIKTTTDSETLAAALVNYNNIYDSDATPATQTWHGDLGRKQVEGGTTTELALSVVGQTEDLNNIESLPHPGAGTVTITGANGTQIAITYNAAAAKQVIVTLDGATELFAGTYDEFDTWLGLLN